MPAIGQRASRNCSMTRVGQYPDARAPWLMHHRVLPTVQRHTVQTGGVPSPLDPTGASHTMHQGTTMHSIPLVLAGHWAALDLFTDAPHRCRSPATLDRAPPRGRQGHLVQPDEVAVARDFGPHSREIQTSRPRWAVRRVNHDRRDIERRGRWEARRVGLGPGVGLRSPLLLSLPRSLPCSARAGGTYGATHSPRTGT